MLPSDLDRALHAVCGAAAGDHGAPVSAGEILRCMADPPSATALAAWLGELVSRKLLRAKDGGWLVTNEGWRAINLLPAEADR